jgi:(p)ppGpp synthase/HD superfamily hydrolase
MDEELIERADHMAALAHSGVKRKYTGEDYIVHPRRVANLVRKTDTMTFVIAALLHDVIEDTKLPPESICTAFGVEALSLVLQLTNPSKGMKLPRDVRKRLDREHLRHVSYGAKVIKLCDRFDNVRDMKGAEPDFKRMYHDESVLLLEVLAGTDAYLEQLLKQALEELLK